MIGNLLQTTSESLVARPGFFVLTFCPIYYKWVGTKLILLFEFDEASQTQTILPLSQLPKSIVASVRHSLFYLDNLLVILYCQNYCYFSKPRIIN